MLLLLVYAELRIKGEAIINELVGGGSQGSKALLQQHSFMRKRFAGQAEYMWGEELTKNPVTWWETYGDLPELSALKPAALKLLCIPPSSCSSERNFSTWGNIWSDKRARMASTRVNKLVFIYFNARSLDRAEVGTSATDHSLFYEWLSSLLDEEQQEEQAAFELAAQVESLLAGVGA